LPIENLHRYYEDYTFIVSADFAESESQNPAATIVTNLIIKKNADKDEENIVHLRNSAVQANLEVDKKVLEDLRKQQPADKELLEEAAQAKAMRGDHTTYRDRYFPMADPDKYFSTIKRNTDAKVKRQLQLGLDVKEFVARGSKKHRAFRSFYQLLADSVDFSDLTPADRLKFMKLEMQCLTVYLLVTVDNMN